jgi:hypothetical protein
MIPRKLEAQLKQAAAQYPLVTLTGPRQSGKTTLIRAVFDDYDYVSLEDPEYRTFAVEDPRAFLEQFGNRAVLDEVQRTPDLFYYIQTLVDSTDRSGQFILSGSQNFLLARTIGQTLAGRCAILHLLPFSLSELMGWDDLPLDEIGGAFPPERKKPPFDLDECLFTGFYPRIHDKRLAPREWLRNYSQTYLERDVRDLVNVGDLEAFRRFMGLCAGRTGQLLNLSGLAADCGISHTTARRWLSVLEASFIVLRLQPHFRNFSKRLVKSPKLYFLDTGLLCHPLRIREPADLALHAARGAIFESFVVSELHKRALHAGREPDLFFWRDSAGNEVDLILDRGVRLIPVEIKSGKTIATDFFKGLHYWRRLAGGEDGPAALVYGGDRSHRRSGSCVYGWYGF